MKKKIIISIRIIAIIFVIILCEKAAITGTETKSENSNLNKTIDLNAMAVKIEEIEQKDLYTPLDVYNGNLTGYVADCPLCSGYLGCNSQNVLDGTTTYMDKDYGEVRIVASSKSLKCGSIVEFNLSSISDEPIVAIVLDRGVRGTALDLLVESEEEARKQIGRKNISYKILRFGYHR